MTSNTGSKYPGYLNPFGDPEDEQEDSKTSIVANLNEYPDHLDPFGGDEENAPLADDYDDSLNPFGDEITPDSPKVKNSSSESVRNISVPDDATDGGNPFSNEDDQDAINCSAPPSIVHEETAELDETPSEPPKPLPRTKSLLKKEQAHKKRLHEQQVPNHDHQAHSLQSITSSTTSSSSTTTDTNPSLSTVGSFQRRKNKRLAPPVPINFKRQVSGSLNAIEEELNGIGDKLAIIDKESTLCQEILTNTNGSPEESDLKTTKSKYAELIRRRNSIVRRQKELMYKKRELKLDQLHSDIEYELRMIGNKQLSSRTETDELKEKELLKKLVEIVEEKNDIVENLNKDTSCDNRDVEEAFRRLNITDHVPLENIATGGGRHNNNNPKPKTITTTSANTGIKTTKILSKKDSYDKSGLAKLSKIATLLPKSNTIKLKRKRLFKKDCDSEPVER